MLDVFERVRYPLETYTTHISLDYLPFKDVMDRISSIPPY